jgi:D-serine dehydratase
MTKYKYIRVEAIVWAKMEHLKAEKSFSTYIESMLKYFELTGINPESLQAPLAQETKNGIERIVKIIKAIEKDKLNRILYLLEDLHQEPQSMVDGVSESQLVEVMNMNEKLDQNIQRLQKEKEALLEKNRDLNVELSQVQKNNGSVGVDTDELKQIAQWFENLEPKNMFSKEVSLTKDALGKIAKRISKAIEYGN